MDRNQRRKIIRLAARAGTILEDTSAAILLLGEVGDDDLASVLAGRRDAVGQAAQLLDKALGLAAPRPSSR